MAQQDELIGRTVRFHIDPPIRVPARTLNDGSVDPEHLISHFGAVLCAVAEDGKATLKIAVRGKGLELRQGVEHGEGPGQWSAEPVA